jgi:4-amino-4-deoxy-L-arabinose transferase-like glycosyltransferase
LDTLRLVALAVLTGAVVGMVAAHKLDLFFWIGLALALLTFLPWLWSRLRPSFSDSAVRDGDDRAPQRH